ncbi:MAG: T9SS type A sorting domain-containing protein [Bacteroidia bacterium]|nr:T9SS type A sorting domain-containing protein [Bacteroidia bacterium]
MKRSLTLLSLFFLFSFAEAQTVSTFLNIAATKVDDAMILDSQGNLFGSHYNGSRVYKITPAGVVSEFASGFNTPNGLAFDSQENLFVCDLFGNRIYKLSISGQFLDTIFIGSPSGIVKMPNSDTMIFTQYLNSNLNKLAPDGSIIQTHSGSPLDGPIGLAYSDTGILYVANFNDRKILEVSSAALNYVATLLGSTSAWLGFITYASSSIWATGVNDHRIYRVYPNYVDSVILYAGSSSGGANGHISIAKFTTPNGILGSEGGDSLYISEFNTGRIRIISGLGATGIYDVDQNDFEIDLFPNPCTDWINVRSNEIIKEISIFDINGKQVLKTDRSTMDIKEFPAGKYCLKVFSRQGVSHASFIKN